MNDGFLSRRGFLRSGGLIAGSHYLHAILPVSAGIAAAACTARDKDAAYRFLAHDEARDFAAIAARIIPTTDTPGASEAGVIHFFDQAFANEMNGSYEFARGGLDAMNASISTGRFSSLDTPTQDRLLAEREGQPFFELCRTMTVFGFFAMNEYGGNKDHIAWDLIGFEGHHGAWQPPFGHYDAQALTEPEPENGE